MACDNAVRSLLESGDIVFGATAVSMSPEIIEVYGDLGLDCVWLGLEHNGPSPYDSETIKDYVRTAENAGIEIVARIPGTDPYMVRKVLDAGIRNITLPRVETAKDLKGAIRAARFSYEGEPGERGASMSKINTWGADMEAYDEREDASVNIGAMIETKTAVDNLDELLSVPELGYIRVGSGDLSVSIAEPLNYTHPEVTDLNRRVKQKASEYDVPLGGRFREPDAVREAIDDGYQYILLGSDISVVRSIIGDRFDAVRDYGSR